ncbi:hypothetical protein RUM44_011341 [Polyplax serrata]|uniref:Uncharacterized protein n=1 Tax=Polyplax serrata TaxID=468196 RepID=A0ABR1AQD8_POLSC
MTKQTKKKEIIYEGHQKNNLFNDLLAGISLVRHLSVICHFFLLHDDQQHLFLSHWLRIPSSASILEIIRKKKKKVQFIRARMCEELRWEWTHGEEKKLDVGSVSAERETRHLKRFEEDLRGSIDRILSKS